MAFGRIYQQQDWDREREEMAQAQADIAALLVQLTAANIARDAAIAVNAAARTREDNLRASTGKIDKCTGDDKRKLRRWIRDVTTIHATHPGISVDVSERTARENLADSVEAFLADAANAPRAGIAWPALSAHIQTSFLGDEYEEVLKAQHRCLRQKPHVDTSDFSERYLASVKDAYAEPWDQAMNMQLIAQFAEGLTDKQTGIYFEFIECFTTTFLRAHSWLNWVDEDDDEDEVRRQKPEDTRYIKKITSK